VDADCDHLANTINTNPNVITTETRDIEGLLILMPALEKVLNEHNLPEQIGGIAIRDLLLAATRTLGYVRWLALRQGWALDFKGLAFSTFINGFTVRCDDLKLAADLINKNPGFAVTGTQIIQDGLTLANTTHNPWHVSRGHDLTKVLAHSASVRSSSKIASSAIESQLRLAMESGHFAATSFCIAICRWQANNRPFVILRAVFCSGSNQTPGAVGSPPQNAARV
jgi:hypothetical protein